MNTAYAMLCSNALLASNCMVSPSEVEKNYNGGDFYGKILGCCSMVNSGCRSFGGIHDTGNKSYFKQKEE